MFVTTLHALALNPLIAPLFMDVIFVIHVKQAENNIWDDWHVTSHPNGLIYPYPPLWSGWV